MKNKKELLIVDSETNKRGLFSYVLQVVSNLYVADLENKELLVDLHTTPYNDIGENCWANYFNQPFRLKKSDYNDYSIFNRKAWFDNHLVIKPILDDNTIKICNFLINKYISIKTDILDIKNCFKKDIIKTENYASVHYRGTDHVVDCEILDKNIYFQNIEKIINDYDKILICSDEQNFIDEVVLNFGCDKIVSYPSIRSNSGAPIHYNNENFKYKSGEDVLIESLLMSESKFLMRTVSNVTHFAIFKNENLKYKNLDEHLYKKYYEKY
jgi:hypothetical protein